MRVLPEQYVPEENFLSLEIKLVTSQVMWPSTGLVGVVPAKIDPLIWSLVTTTGRLGDYSAVTGSAKMDTIVNKKTASARRFWALNTFLS